MFMILVVNAHWVVTAVNGRNQPKGYWVYLGDDKERKGKKKK